TVVRRPGGARPPDRTARRARPERAIAVSMTLAAHEMRSLECLSPQECGDVREALHGLRDRWDTPGPAAPFQFFGAASYIDGRGRDGMTYRQRVAALRPLMLERFGWVYDRVAVRLSEALG